jgi:general secretion pathway protein G
MTSKMQKPRRHIRGFTLLELLVVLVILALLGSIAGPRVVGYLGSSKTKTAKLQIDQFGQGLDLYLLEMGRYPNTREGLAALVEEPSRATGWNGPYISGVNNVPQDPWGNEYIYTSPGKKNKTFDISSLGSDGLVGGEDENQDVNNWDN